MNTLRKQAGQIALLAGLVGGLSAPLDAPTHKRGIPQKSILSKKQKKSRAKAKRAKKSRKRNR